MRSRLDDQHVDACDDDRLVQMPAEGDAIAAVIDAQGGEPRLRPRLLGFDLCVDEGLSRRHRCGAGLVDVEEGLASGLLILERMMLQGGKEGWKKGNRKDGVYVPLWTRWA